MTDSYRPGSVEFSEPATYSGRKRINVSVRREDYTFSHTVLYLVKVDPGRQGWVIVMPHRTVSVGHSWDILPERTLTGPNSLKKTKARASWLIMAAGSDERLGELRTATEVPEWAK